MLILLTFTLCDSKDVSESCIDTNYFDTRVKDMSDLKEN